MNRITKPTLLSEFICGGPKRPCFELFICLGSNPDTLTFSVILRIST
tara:strand:+ start:347 stop:487 length:141 start_codon:yes stop_codon:yes gene_type:complete